MRPGHFTGVATIVTKLLAIICPDLAFFGEKDYQQLCIVERVVRDLDIPTTVVACPIVREPDGLAMSSRNVRLDAQARVSALALWEALKAATRALAEGETSGEALERVMVEQFASRPGIELDYAAVVDPLTLEPMRFVDRVARALVAGRIGSLRLIDNAPLAPPVCETPTPS